MLVLIAELFIPMDLFGAQMLDYPIVIGAKLLD
jgi:hypothetical protein